MIDKDFITAGKAVFTIEPSPAFRASYPEAKDHYTYMVTHKEADDQWPETWFIKLLVGPDNTRDYQYLGKLLADSGAVKLTAKSSWGQDAVPVKLLDNVLKAIWDGQSEAIEQAGCKVHHMGRCGRCNRPLTDPTSVLSGVGPECAKALG